MKGSVHANIDRLRDVFGSVEEFAEYHRSGPLGEPIDGGYARSKA